MQPRAGTVVQLLVVILLVSSASAPGSGYAGFHAFADSISVSKKADEVILSFDEGVRLISSDGSRVGASKGKVILSTKGFSRLPTEISREDVRAGKLPKLPEVSFSKKQIRLLRLSGSVSLKSKDFSVYGQALETRNGGDSWNLIGDFSLVFSDGSGRRVLGRNFVYDATAKRVITFNPVQLSGFVKTFELVTMEASKITLNLKNRVISLAGSARLSFGDYVLSSEEILANLERRTIETAGEATLITRESVIKAQEIRIQVEDSKVKVSASGLSGNVRVR